MQLPQEKSEGPEAQAPVSVVVPLLHQTVNADTMKIQPHSIISKMKCIPALFQKKPTKLLHYFIFQCPIFTKHQSSRRYLYKHSQCTHYYWV
jgi:hypothetical protein